MSNLLNFENSIKLLRNAVKHSALDNQKHIDLSVINAPERISYQKALMVVQSMVSRGEISQQEVNSKLGLI